MMTLGSCTDYLFSAEARQQGIFGVPLRQSITYANVAISLVDDNGQSYIYGYVPIVVAKCGVFLKEKGKQPPPWILNNKPRLTILVQQPLVLRVYFASAGRRNASRS